MAGPDDGLEGWIAEQFRFSGAALMRAISATHLVKERPGFHQRVAPSPGSVLASPELASYDPDPDYFFHWFRDAALVVEALRVLIEEGAAGPAGLERFGEFLRFNLSLKAERGAGWLDGSRPRPNAEPDFRQFLRPEAELAAASGERVPTETRVNPDGTVDFIKWNRPQTDGSALRALTLLRFLRMEAVDEGMRAAMRELIDDDLRLTARTWREPSFDVWEEELGHHYYTRRVQAAALAEGAAWKAEAGETGLGESYRTAAAEIAAALDQHWSDDLGSYRSRMGPARGAPHRTLDIATILAIVHVGATGGAHSVLDPRAQATLVQIEELFDGAFTINRGRPPGRAPALGRYLDDIYYGGGAFYFSTLAAAEFHFQLAAAVASRGARLPPASDDFRRRVLGIVRTAAGDPGPPSPGGTQELGLALVRRGDMFLATVRAFTPESHALSEQFDRETGRQTSAKHLTWSYAALITAASARRRALRRLDPNSDGRNGVAPADVGPSKEGP